MSYKRKAKGYFIFAFASIAVIYIVAAVIVQLVFSDKEAEFVSYPNYSYVEYIDRSENMNFTKGGGAQLYEAESAKHENCEASEISIASGGSAVEAYDDSVVSYTIISDSEQTALLTLRTMYISQNETDISAANLLNFSLNGEEVDVRNVSVLHSESWCDFKDNRLCEINLRRGENTLRIERKNWDYTLDYIVLTAKGTRTDTDEPIGVPVSLFKNTESRQLYNVQSAVATDGVLVYDYDVAGRYYLRQDGEGSRLSFFIECSEACTVNFSVSINNYGASEYISDSYNVYVNDLLHRTDIMLPVTKKGESFSEESFGAVSLEGGLNEIQIYSKSGGYAVNYIVLNADIDFSPSFITQRYEAEDGILSGGCKQEYNASASGNYNVGYNSSGSSVSIAFRTAGVEKSVMLSIGMSYVNSRAAISTLLSVVVNGMTMNLNNVYVNPTGGYNVYTEVHLGWISVLSGENKIVVTCAAGGYNLDYIALYTENISTETRYEAEQAAITGGCWVESFSTSSAGKDVGCNSRNSAVHFSFYSDKEVTLTLIAAFSTSSAEDMLLSDVLTITVNGTNIDIYGVVLSGTGSWRVFLENEICALELIQGVNTISITSKSEQYNLDYIRFAQ